MEFTARPIMESDLEEIMNWRMSPEVTTYMNTNPKLTLEGQKKWFDSLKQKNTVKYWMIEVDGQPAGVLNLADIDYEKKNTSWAYYIGEKSLRSMELAISMELSLYDYVFETMELEEIHGEVFSINAGVIKLHQLCGCRVEKVIEGEVEKEGQRYDVAHLTLTKKEWLTNKDKYNYQHIEL
ncbi:UDP-4-amino-4,6-dideoxy-N-acetyl-beta-L-altrosamine N-acetyltransferase [Lachnospiraceae bacterium KHCPX20]|nr:UDP-4-amino-4,6-dideoxy-N-acetyl-beta-L-altrosamine N-acetyltransferase [Lachnospiraceae bacterium KHCPX20]